MKAHTSIRIPCRTHADAKELALRLEADEYAVTRRWKAVVVRTQTQADAARLALALGVEYETGATESWSSGPAPVTT